MGGKWWKSEEIEFLKIHYSDYSNKHLSKILNRSCASVLSMARSFELFKSKCYISKANTDRTRGRILSEETKQRISDSLKGKFKAELNPNFGNWWSDEQCKRLSEKVKKSGRYVGENNPTWKGGVSFEPYCIKFNDEFKERIREYWNRKCVVCDMDEKMNGRRMDVHHVEYNKETCCDDSIPLFVSLCKKCHRKTHGNRDFWIGEFKRIIYSKNMTGKCYLTCDEMERKTKHQGNIK